MHESSASGEIQECRTRGAANTPAQCAVPVGFQDEGVDIVPLHKGMIDAKVIDVTLDTDEPLWNDDKVVAGVCAAGEPGAVDVSFLDCARGRDRACHRNAQPDIPTDVETRPVVRRCEQWGVGKGQKGQTLAGTAEP